MMSNRESISTCPLCNNSTLPNNLTEGAWLAPEVIAELVRIHPHWQHSTGNYPAAIQYALLHTLLEQGEAALHQWLERVWPLDAEAAFHALPTPLRMQANPHYTGRGVTLALLDAAFYPHPDLIMPRNRIRAWVNAGTEPLQVIRFGPDETPRWPGWDYSEPAQWHGLMTSTVAAGNGWLSHGLYCGLACEAELVLIQVRDQNGHIGNASIARALQWLHNNGHELGVRVVNMSLGGDEVQYLAGNPVDEAVARLVAEGITVVVAAGNDGVRRLVPPGTAPAALTIGGLDDKNTFNHAELTLWHSNYGDSSRGLRKPELVAPSIWVVAPVLPNTSVATEAVDLFARRAQGDAEIEARLRDYKLVTPYYQHVDGTSFAAPLVSSVAACMLEANPALTTEQIRDMLIATAEPVPGVSSERQGAGALKASEAVAATRRKHHGSLSALTLGPLSTPIGIAFLYHDHHAQQVEVRGSWDGWKVPGLIAEQIEDGIWQTPITHIRPGTYTYKILVDGTRWLEDPANPDRAPDEYGSMNSILRVYR